MPQRRTRLFIIAVRQDLDGFPSKPEVTHYEDDYLTTSWAIADLEKVTDESIPNQSQFFRAARAKMAMAKVMRERRHTHHHIR